MRGFCSLLTFGPLFSDSLVSSVILWALLGGYEVADEFSAVGGVEYMYF